MSLGNALRRFALAALPLPLVLLGGCSGGGSSSTLNAILGAVQDLSVDPEGKTTVVSFGSTSGLSLAAAANFEADGGQTALSAVVAGSDVTVTWDERVTPSHQVRAFGLASVSTAFFDVTTSDASAPTFTITDADQNAGLGTDTIEVTFAGPYVAEELAEDPARWTFFEDGRTIDLAGSTFALNAATQVLDITLAPTVGLHASFTLTASGVTSVADVAVAGGAVAGVATGDAAAPTLASADQNLSEDEYGRVVDFTFDEAMDPVFCAGLSHFQAAPPDVATTVEQVSDTVLRVTFNNPIVPGFDSITLAGLVDAHGNAHAGGAQAITQPSPVANAYDGSVLGVTVENAGNDYIEVKTTQAFDPDSAVDPASWTLTVAGNPVNMALQTFDYDFLGKTLTITLDFDMVNGNTFTIIGNGVRDVDGDAFNAGQFQTIAGETSPPTVVSALQNRTIDVTGRTLDVQMSEDVDVVLAETLTSWSSSGTQNLLSATLLPSLDRVRLVFDGAMVPQYQTLTAQDVDDLAGNAMPAPQAGIVITSTDTTPPAAIAATVTAVEGANDDTVVVTFSDDMVPADVEDPTIWTFESPVGYPASTTGATAVYDTATRTATLTFVNGTDLRRGDDYEVGFVFGSDLGGNAITAATLTGNVAFETTLPAVHAAWRDALVQDEVVVRFTEPCGQLDDLYDVSLNPDGTRYVLRDSSGILRVLATGATVLDDGLGVRLSFGIVVAASDTLDVLSLEDLCGNPMFPALDVPTVVEDLAQPSLAAGQSALASVSGERNDVITVVFDRPMSPWKLLDPSHYDVDGGPSLVDFAGAEFAFDGNDTVTIDLRAVAGSYELFTGGGYDLTIDDVLSAQGTLRSSADTELGITVAGDAVAPNVVAGKVRIDPTTADSLLVEFTEAMSPLSATAPGNYDLGGGDTPIAALLLGPRVARLTFAVTPAIAQSLVLDVNDLAANGSGSISRAVTAADAAGPLVASVSGLAVAGYGRDEVHVAFDEPVTAATALNGTNYAVSSGGVSLSLAGATLSYASATNAVTIRLAGGFEIDASAPIAVTVGGIADFSGNMMGSSIQVGGPVTGDLTAPAFENAFVNWREDPTGRVVDVLFTEDVDASQAGSPASWTATGATVSSVVLLERDHARVTLSAALAAAGTLQMTGLADLASNASGAISIDPLE